MTSIQVFRFRWSAIGGAIILLWSAVAVMLILNTFGVFDRNSLVVGRWIYTLNFAATAATFARCLYRHAERMAAILSSRDGGGEVHPIKRSRGTP